MTTDWILLIVQVLAARSWKSRGEPATTPAAAKGIRIFDARIAPYYLILISEANKRMYKWELCEM